MVHVHAGQHCSDREWVRYVWLTGSARLAIVCLLGIEVGALYVVDPLGGQVARENILEASKRLSLIV
jgi:hypothetical protein